MSGKQCTSKERIIPIQMEASNDNLVENKKTEMGSGEPSTPQAQRERGVSIQVEVDNSVDERKEESVLRSSLDATNQGEDSDNIISMKLKKNVLPMFNVKEKIVLVVDSAEDENFTPFWLSKGQKNKPLDMLKYAATMFLKHKQLINKKHEYALAVLNENNVIWIEDFTSRVDNIIHALEEINSCQTEDIFHLNSLFNFICQKVEVPQLCKVEDIILPPPYIVRTILLYGRSYTMPELHTNKEIQDLLKSPYFILDVLMTHEPIDDNNNCNKIFNVLQNLDTKGHSYFLPVGRDTKALISSMGKLLGHPLQRPLQKLASYSIKNL